jgi:hypothetical protein
MPSGGVHPIAPGIFAGPPADAPVPNPDAAPADNAEVPVVEVGICYHLSAAVLSFMPFRAITSELPMVERALVAEDRDGLDRGILWQCALGDRAQPFPRSIRAKFSTDISLIFLASAPVTMTVIRSRRIIYSNRFNSFSGFRAEQGDFR